MSTTLRKKAIANIVARKFSKIENLSRNVSDIYGEDVFNIKTMKDFLSKEAYKSLLATIREGESLKADIADEVANAMKSWATIKGATHYTHWFQPLTGSTAEKHDSFIEPDIEGGVVLDFSGKTLIKGEPDASSFPSGGIRATFEARGYTVWDPTSPAFIKRGQNGATLCIPTAFNSYTGDSLDKKTPLLKSMQAISIEAERLLQCFNVNVKDRVNITLGAEQEYFLIDKEFYYTRKDLYQCGRTLFGRIPPKHQQLDDHYFGAIKPRVLAFMSEVDNRLWRLGVPAKTRHNEVAPSQFELAAQFEELNLAVDHNMIIMETLNEVAEKHGFVCLMHEKPFAGINGSGKHNNWSFSANGINLLNPGHNPHENAIFLTVLCAIIKAVDKHADLMLASISCAGNSHRLGANEAPPAIISIFLGEQLTDIIKQIELGGATSAKQGGSMLIGVDTLPDLPKDVTDRNRTSPFAFTGNKFEFRAVGSSQNCADPNIVLNAIVADAFNEISSELEEVEDGDHFNSKLQDILQNIIKEHKKIIFNGDNYSEEWLEEATQRGLPNISDVPEALNAFISDKSVKLFSSLNILSEKELHARFDVYMENYEKIIAIESHVGLSLAKRIILPACMNYQSKLLDNLVRLRSSQINAGEKTLVKQIEKIGLLIDKAADQIDVLISRIDDEEIEAEKIAALDNLRLSIDELEREVDDAIWPLPKYSEMLFIS
ncbi:MAG TPA: glutamine synthetase III [Victivallales bacterium]|nr:glutamine synthetase III [Victivallales bacterium]